MAPNFVAESCKKKKTNEFIPFVFDCKDSLKKAEEEIKKEYPDVGVFGNERVLFVEDKSKLLSMTILESVKKLGGKLSTSF